MSVAIDLLYSYIVWDRACTLLGNAIKDHTSTSYEDAVRKAANEVLECGFDYHDELCAVADPLATSDDGWDFANEEIVDTRNALYRAWDFAHLGDPNPSKIQDDPRLSWDEDDEFWNAAVGASIEAVPS